jgi:hypothetical protein
VHARDPKHGIDIVLGQELDKKTADVARHVNLLDFERYFAKRARIAHCQQVGKRKDAIFVSG